jgi:hypothetical protein
MNPSISTIYQASRFKLRVKESMNRNVARRLVLRFFQTVHPKRNHLPIGSRDLDQEPTVLRLSESGAQMGKGTQRLSESFHCDRREARSGKPISVHSFGDRETVSDTVCRNRKGVAQPQAVIQDLQDVMTSFMKLYQLANELQSLSPPVECPPVQIAFCVSAAHPILFDLSSLVANWGASTIANLRIHGGTTSGHSSTTGHIVSQELVLAMVMCSRGVESGDSAHIRKFHLDL